MLECDAGIPWAEPRDLEIEESLALLASADPRAVHGRRQETFFYEHFQGSHILFADGEVRFAPDGTDQETWRGLLTVNDGIPEADWDGIAARSFGERRLRIGNCCRLGLFLFLVLFPLPWVWVNPTSGIIIDRQ